jgi:hypothetical protein
LLILGSKLVLGFGVLWREDENFELLKCITECSSLASKQFSSTLASVNDTYTDLKKNFHLFRSILLKLPHFMF